MKRAWGFPLVAVAVALLAAPAPAHAQENAEGRATLVLVRAWGWPEAREVADAAREAGRGLAAGFVSTLPADAELAPRVLALAAGARVDTGALAGGSGPRAVEALREDNPDAALSGLAPTRVLADPGLEAAGLMAIAADGAAAAEAVGSDGELLPEAGGLLVVAVADAARAQALLGRLDPDGPVLLAGLEPTPGRARTAPFLQLGQPGGAGGQREGGGGSLAADGLVTSDATRRDGLVALEDVRATLQEAAGATTGSSDGSSDDSPGTGDGLPGGSPVRVEAREEALDAAAALDRQIAALVTAKPWAIAAVVLSGGFAILLALAVRTLGGAADGRRARTARAWLLLTFAIPSGYLVASWTAPPQPAVLVAAGVAAAAVLAAAAAPARTAAPGVLGLLLLLLVTADLATGGAALARPLVSGSAFDGERFYGIGNGTLGYALAGVICAAAFLPLRRAAATALLVALALVAGLPALGANVGGALTGMLTAAAAWLLLGRRPLRPARMLAAAAAAVAAGLVVGLVVGAVTGDTTHGTGFVDRVAEGGPAAALRVFAHRVGLNLALLAGSPFGWVGPSLVAIAAVSVTARPLGLDDVSEHVIRTLQAGVAGAVALMVLNDSGVTAAIGCGLVLLLGLAWSLVPPPGGTRLATRNGAGLAALARLSDSPTSKDIGTTTDPDPGSPG
jgi:hypothetical protein